MSSEDQRLRLAENDIDRHEKRLGDHDVEFGKAKLAIAGVTQAVETLTQAAKVATTPAFSWFLTDDLEKAEQKLLDLEGWLGTVLAHYPGGILADCWRRHPVVVEELLVLADGHKAAWGPKGKVSDRFDWLNRWVPESIKRVTADLTACSLTNKRHNPAELHDFKARSQVGNDTAEAVTPWWVRSHGQQIEPSPSADAIAESKARKAADLTERNRV